MISPGQLLVKSKFVQQVRAEKGSIIWHSLFGYPKFVSSQTLEILDLFSNPRSINSVLDKYEIANWKHVFQELISGYYLIPSGFDERRFLNSIIEKRNSLLSTGSFIDYLELRVSEACNFRCSYCIQRSVLKRSEANQRLDKLMSLSVAQKAVDGFLKILNSHRKDIAEISFGGGEPLLNWPVIEKVMDYCHLKYNKKFVLRFSINTNGSLITPRIIEKLLRYKVEIAPSLDGLKEGNDKVRLTRNKRGTFETILKAFDLLKTYRFPLKGVTSTLNEENFCYLNEDFIDWAAERRMREVHVDVDVVNIVNIPVKELVTKLINLRRYARLRRIGLSGFWARPLENLNDSIIDTVVAFCGAARGNNLCIDPLGKIYACGYSNQCLGSIDQLQKFFSTNNRYYRFVIDHTIGSIKKCRGCIIEGQCGGGCIVTQEFADITKNQKTETMCDFYRVATIELLREKCLEILKKGGDN